MGSEVCKFEHNSFYEMVKPAWIAIINQIILKYFLFVIKIFPYVSDHVNVPVVNVSWTKNHRRIKYIISITNRKQSYGLGDIYE